MAAGDAINTRQFTQQAWYHAGRPDFLDNPMFVHVGTRQAAEERIAPKTWANDGEERLLQMRRHSGLYEVRLAHGARVSPELETDEDMSYRYAPTSRHKESLQRAGRQLWDDETVLSGEDYDAYPYVNEYEAKGSVSLLANPEKLRMVRRLR